MATRRQITLIALAIAMLGIALWVAVGTLHREDSMHVVRDYFVDEETFAFERHVTGDFPPLAGRQGHAVVIAKCFKGDDGLIIGWLMRYPVEMKQRLDAARTGGDLGPGLLIAASLAAEVRRPEPGAEWVGRSSPSGLRICIGPKLKDGRDAIPAQPKE